MVLLYYLGMFFCSLFSTYSVQKYSRAARGMPDYFIYVFVTGSVAMGVFSILSGFSFSFNKRTVIYSLIFAAIVITTHMVSLGTLRFMQIVQTSLISSSLSLIMTLAAGYYFFSEEVTWLSVLRILMMVAAAWLTVPASGKNNTQVSSDKKRFLVGLCLCAASVLVSTAANVVTKAFAVDTAVTDSNSMFFLTNAWMVLLCPVILLILHRGRFRSLIRGLRGVSLSQYGVTVLNTVTSNISTLLSVQILAAIPLSVHTPVSGALGKIATAAVAVFIAKEKVPVLPVLLSVAAMLLSFFET